MPPFYFGLNPVRVIYPKHRNGNTKPGRDRTKDRRRRKDARRSRQRNRRRR